jgi:transcriptional regulator with XRE-family HTH domain
MTLGEIIRRQRELAELSLRQLASMIGVSNPYLSQIERGLRAPSEQVLRSIAAALQTSADALVDQVERESPAKGQMPAVVAAVHDDPGLTARQRHALADIYAAFIEQTAANRRRRGRRSTNGRRPGEG